MFDDCHSCDSDRPCYAMERNTVKSGHLPGAVRFEACANKEPWPFSHRMYPAVARFDPAERRARSGLSRSISCDDHIFRQLLLLRGTSQKNAVEMFKAFLARIKSLTAATHRIGHVPRRRESLASSPRRQWRSSTSREKETPPSRSRTHPPLGFANGLPSLSSRTGCGRILPNRLWDSSTIASPAEGHARSLRCSRGHLLSPRKIDGNPHIPRIPVTPFAANKGR